MYCPPASKTHEKAPKSGLPDLRMQVGQAALFKDVQNTIDQKVSCVPQRE